MDRQDRTSVGTEDSCSLNCNSDSKFRQQFASARATLRAPELALRSWVLRDWEIRDFARPSGQGGTLFIIAVEADSFHSWPMGPRHRSGGPLGRFRFWRPLGARRSWRRCARPTEALSDGSLVVLAALASPAEAKSRAPITK